MSTSPLINLYTFVVTITNCSALRSLSSSMLDTVELKKRTDFVTTVVESKANFHAKIGLPAYHNALEPPNINAAFGHHINCQVISKCGVLVFHRSMNLAVCQ